MSTISNRLFRESADKIKWATLTAISKHISRLGNKKTEEILLDAKVPRHVILVEGRPEPEFILELAKNAIFEWRRKLNENQKKRRK